MTTSLPSPPTELIGVTSGFATINVSCAVPGLLNEVGRTVAPVYRLGTPHETPRVTVRVVLRDEVGVDQDVLADTWRLPTLSMGPDSTVFVCVGHEAGVVRWLRERENDAGPLLITADRERGTVELEIYDRSGETVRAVSRTLSYLLGAQMETAGVPVYHGSAVAKNGRGVLVLGRAGSGKSTLAFQVCTLGGWEFLADDLVYVWRRSAAGPLMVSGWPKRVAVSTSALLEHPARPDFERASLRWHGGPVGPLAEDGARPWGAEHRQRIFCDLEEFFPLTGVAGTSEAGLSGVVLPVADRDHHGWRIERVTGGEWLDDPDCRASTRQRKHGIDFLGILPHQAPDLAERERVRAALAGLPCVRVRYGADVNRHIPAFWAEVTDRLAGC